MKNTSQSRNFAESMGQAMAFGIGVTCCDIFSSPQVSGYVHGVRHGEEAQFDIKSAFTIDKYLLWRDMMHKAELMGSRRDHDPCGYGVAIHRTGPLITMQTIRCHMFMENALDSAESEMTERFIYHISDCDALIYLEQHGKIPGSTEGFVEGYENYEHEYVPYDGEYNARRAVRIAEASTRLGGRL